MQPDLTWPGLAWPGLSWLGFGLVRFALGQGADGEFEALALIRMLCCTFKASLRYIVIKSKCMLHHASVFTPAGDLDLLVPPPPGGDAALPRK